MLYSIIMNKQARFLGLHHLEIRNCKCPNISIQFPDPPIFALLLDNDDISLLIGEFITSLGLVRKFGPATKKRPTIISRNQTTSTRARPRLPRALPPTGSLQRRKRKLLNKLKLGEKLFGKARTFFS